MGTFAFSEWYFSGKCLCDTAKDVIRGLLKTDPDERLTIREVMQSNWVSVGRLFLDISTTFIFKPLTCLKVN